MANRFWVGGGSANTWAATGNTNWAATSGGANNQSVPGVGDVAIFDSNSGVGNSVIGANITIQGLDCTGGTGNYAGTITHNNSVTLTINTGAASSFRFSAGMTYTIGGLTSIVTFTHTSGTATITSNGKRFAALTVNGAGGTTTPTDALRVDATTNSPLTVTSGIFDAGTNTVAITACRFVLSGAVTRSVILGGLVKIGGNLGNSQTIWGAGTTTGLTFTKNSANIEIVALAGAVASGQIFDGGGLTYNDLTLDATSAVTYLNVTGANTFAHLAVNPGWGLILPGSTTTTVSNAFTLAGTRTNPIGIVSSSNVVTTISVASGACTLTWGSLMGVFAVGGATFTATNVLDCGQNSGWSISPPADAATTNTAAQIAAAVWQDIVAGDFTVPSSVGLSVMNGVALGTALKVTQDMTQALPSAPTANSIGEALFIADNLAGRMGTAQAGAASTITLDSGASSVDGRYVGYRVFLSGGTGGGIRGVGQERTIVSYVGSTKVATVAQPWGTNPDATTTFILYVQPWANVGSWNGTVVATPNVAGVPIIDLKYTLGTTSAGAAGSVRADQVTGSVASVASGGITAASFAANALDAVWSTSVRSLSTFGSLVTDVATAVWGAATRTLTSGLNIALAKGVGVTGFTDIDATGVRNAVGLATNNLDSQLDALPTITELTAGLAATVTATDAAVTSSHGSGSYVRNTEPPTANENADAHLDRADGIEVGLTPRQAQRLIAAATAGKLSGAATTTNTIRNAVADSKDRIVATVDSSGNRSAITVDLT